jgi:transcriptional regulator NrdR family protein
MVCIYCHGDLAVTNSRPQKRRNQTWRRRLCKTCGALFTSVEAIDLSQALVVANGTKLQPFDRDRLFLSLHESLRHRPTALSDARALAETVAAQLIKVSENGLLPATAIRRTALNTLQRFDHAAATHYAAYHLQSR